MWVDTVKGWVLFVLFVTVADAGKCLWNVAYFMVNTGRRKRQEFLINGYVACYFRYMYCGICTYILMGGWGE